MELSNCNAVITGGASGLGGATADIIINNGGRVTIIDIQNDLGIKKAEELGSNCNYIKYWLHKFSCKLCRNWKS